MKLQKKQEIVDVKTGEVIEIEKATDMQLSEFLTDINYKRKQSAKIEQAVKKHIKSKRIKGEDFDDNGVMLFGHHQIKRYYSYRFDTKKLMKEGTKEEIALFEKLKKKYTVGTEIVKI